MIAAPWCRYCKDCAKLASKQSDEDSRSAGFIRAFIDVKNAGVNCRFVLYKKDVLEFLQRQELMVRDEDVFCRSLQSGNWNLR